MNDHAGLFADFGHSPDSRLQCWPETCVSAMASMFFALAEVSDFYHHERL